MVEPQALVDVWPAPKPEREKTDRDQDDQRNVHDLPATS